MLTQDGTTSVKPECTNSRLLRLGLSFPAPQTVVSHAQVKGLLETTGNDGQRLQHAGNGRVPLAPDCRQSDVLISNEIECAG